MCSTRHNMGHTPAVTSHVPFKHDIRGAFEDHNSSDVDRPLTGSLRKQTLEPYLDYRIISPGPMEILTWKSAFLQA